MKYLSLLVFLFAMHWSWSLVHDPANVSENVHIGIQDDLKRVISDYIQENLPQSKNLRFERFWTENIKKNQVKASFIYSFEDNAESVGPARVEIEGYAILNRDSNTDEEYDFWNFDELYILNNRIDFKEPLKVDPRGNESEAEETTSAAPEPPPEVQPQPPAQPEPPTETPAQ